MTTELVDKTVDRNPKLVDRLFDLMRATLLDGDPNLAPPHHVDLGVASVRAVLLHHAELFVVGHEVGHCLLGHLASAEARTALKVGVVDANVCRLEHTQELLADFVGAAIADASASETASSYGSRGQAVADFAFVAPDFFFTATALLEEFMALGDSGWCSADTHPTSTDRRTKRRQFLESINSQRPLDMGDRLQIVVEGMASRVRQPFSDLLASGEHLSRGWAHPKPV